MASTSNNLSSDTLDATFIFNCDIHSAIISKKLLNFYEENELFDVVLIVGSNSCVPIQAHRVVLCALSEYFLEIFRETKPFSKENVVELKEIEPSILKPIIDFMYKGSIELSRKTMMEILKTASFLKIETLFDGCCELIAQSMNCDNALNCLQLANELSSPMLKAKSLECIYTNFKQILIKEELLVLSASELKDILFTNNPHDDFEEDVFLFIMAWINFDKTSREHLIFELLSMVHFQALTAKFIVENRKSICKTVESYELTDKWLQWHLSPETHSNDQPDCTSRPRKRYKKMPDKLGLICIRNSEIIIKSFNPQINSWSTEIQTRSPTDTNYFSTIVIDNKLILFGGSNSSDVNAKAVECLDLDTSEWINFPPMNKYKKRYPFGYLNGHLCVFGSDPNNDQKCIELYNLSTQKWHNLKLLFPMSKTAKIATHNEMLYILDSENGYLTFYNISSNKWTSTEIEKDSITDFGFAASEKFVYVIGGLLYVTSNEFFDDENPVHTVKRYDIINNSWSEMTPLPPSPYSRYFMQAKLLKNKILIWHGYDKIHVEELNLDTKTWHSLGNGDMHGFTFCTPTYLK